MKYLKITTQDIIWGKNEITKEELSQLKCGQLIALINLEDMTFFYADENRWERIGHD